MSGTYPHFKSSYTHEELVEHFLLTPADLQLILTCRGEANRCGMALLLKALTYLGYVPDSLDDVPLDVRRSRFGEEESSCIVSQLAFSYPYLRDRSYRVDSSHDGMPK
jgi:hypothetical protein